MTPVALWTGRLPGLRPLPRRRTLWLVGATVVLGIGGSFGILGPQGPWLGAAASLLAGWTVWRHRWPTASPRRSRPLEAPQGPDERAVRVEFRHDGDLLGWDVGILWFEKGGVGFVGRTVSFVLPRAMMANSPGPAAWNAALSAPQMTARVFETTVGIVPLDRDLQAYTTLARIDALPDAVTSETILPPSSMHPDLLQQALTVRRRVPFVAFLAVASFAMLTIPNAFGIQADRAARLVSALIQLAVLLLSMLGLAPLPASIRAGLPVNRASDGRSCNRSKHSWRGSPDHRASGASRPPETVSKRG